MSAAIGTRDAASQPPSPPALHLTMKAPLLLSLLALLALLALLPTQGAEIRGSGRSSSPSFTTGRKLDNATRKSPSVTAAKRRVRHMSKEELRRAAIAAGPIRPTLDQSHRTNFPDPKTQPQTNRPGTMPWHFDITATYFYIGELATKRNPTPNTASSWDSMWDDNYGGYDDPNPANRDPVTYAPLGFTPQLNPFYVALPYNDVDRGGPKPEASRVIPWYRRDKGGKYESVCRGTWVQIYYNGKYCFAQWEDCGPFRTDDWEYVFRNAPPKNHANNAAGIDLSPAVRDYLGIKGGMAKVHWRFVDFSLVPGGPWARYGKDNPFVNPSLKHAIRKFQIKNRISTQPLRARRSAGGSARRS